MAGRIQPFACPFQFLIGKIQTGEKKTIEYEEVLFQFLIGKIQTKAAT